MAETYVAFLRAINVGNRRVAMDDLVAHLETLDDIDVIGTYLASGNVSFRSNSSAALLQDSIAAHLERQLGYDVPTIVRSLDELCAIVASPVFAEASAPKHRKLYVTFLSAAPADPAILDTLSNHVDSFQLVDRDIFWLRDVDAGESMNNYDLEKAIDVVGTRRTMNTIQRIVKKLT